MLIVTLLSDYRVTLCYLCKEYIFLWFKDMLWKHCDPVHAERTLVNTEFSQRLQRLLKTQD